MVTNLTEIIYTHIEAVKDVIGQLKEQRTVKKKTSYVTLNNHSTQLYHFSCELKIHICSYNLSQSQLNLVDFSYIARECSDSFVGLVILHSSLKGGCCSISDDLYRSWFDILFYVTD